MEVDLQVLVEAHLATVMGVGAAIATQTAEEEFSALSSVRGRADSQIGVGQVRVKAQRPVGVSLVPGAIVLTNG